MNLSREFDIIVWGASGFTGRLVVLYLFNKYGVTGDLKWAMGGRNLIKLKTVRDEVGLVKTGNNSSCITAVTNVVKPLSIAISATVSSGKSNSETTCTTPLSAVISAVET